MMSTDMMGIVINVCIHTQRVNINRMLLAFPQYIHEVHVDTTSSANSGGVEASLSTLYLSVTLCTIGLITNICGETCMIFNL